MLFDNAPEGLVEALAASALTPGVPKMGTTSLRMYAADEMLRSPQDPPLEVTPELQAELDGFLEKSGALAARAQAALAGLHETDPIDLTSGRMPEWWTKEWASVLRFPYAADLEEAVIAAEAWLA